MKKLFLSILIIFIGLVSYGCIGYAYGASLYPDQEQQNLIIDPNRTQFIYTDDYLNFGWDNLDRAAIYCCYYDFSDIMLIAYGNRVFFVPYDWFYWHIANHHRFSLYFYSFDWFANYFGMDWYDWCWGQYYWNHYRPYYHRGYHYYYEHRIYHPTVLRKDQLTDPSRFHSTRKLEALPYLQSQRRIPTSMNRPTFYSYHSDSRISSRPNTPYTPKHSTSPYRSNSNNSRPTSRGTSHSTFRNSGGSTLTKHKH